MVGGGAGAIQFGKYTRTCSWNFHVCISLRHAFSMIVLENKLDLGSGMCASHLSGSVAEPLDMKSPHLEKRIRLGLSSYFKSA